MKLNIFIEQTIKSNDYELSIVPTILIIRNHELNKMLVGSDNINNYFK